MENAKLETEQTFNRFVEKFGGSRVESLLCKSPNFSNADYIFEKSNVIAELKTLESDFGNSEKFRLKHVELLMKYVTDKKIGVKHLFNNQDLPKEYINDFVRLFRPPLSRILKKANQQIKETKSHLGKPDSFGLLLLANDGFSSLEPRFIISIISNLLLHSYSSIDGFVYFTLNQYSDTGDSSANLLWIALYSEKAQKKLPSFVNQLGKEWADFLEQELGEFDFRSSTDDGLDVLLNAKAIPSELLKF